MPPPPDPPPAIDQSWGRIRSSYGPSNPRMKAAETLRWPARTKIRPVLIGAAPRPSAPAPVRAWCNRATLSPSIEMSMSSKRELAPEEKPSSKTYSPSAGKTCSTTTPPRVPYGVPSTRSQGCWEVYSDTL